jgi:hypothetical protein
MCHRDCRRVLAWGDFLRLGPLQAAHTKGLCTYSYGSELLFVIFDDLRRTPLGLVWITPKLSQGSTLAQQIPTLVQFDLYLR